MQTWREVEVSVNLVDQRRRPAEADCRDAGRRCTAQRHSGDQRKDPFFAYLSSDPSRLPHATATPAIVDAFTGLRQYTCGPDQGLLLSLAMGLTTILTTIWVCPPKYA
jgi:hypothetical protein